VGKLKRTLESIHGTEATEERRTVSLAALTPTQTKVYTDELEGRRYELENGLAEPLVVIDNAGTLLLADGHHRVKAADRLDIEEMDAYVISLDRRVELGMAETAKKSNLESIDDIEEVDYGHHPLVETTERLQDS
jgi:ParB-like chromosome segregation protein Spo0J